MRKVLTLLVVLAILFSSTTVLAIQPQEKTLPLGGEYGVMYTGLNSITSGLNITSGTATCAGIAKATSGYSIQMTMTLQKSSGGSWSSVTSWSGSGQGTTGISLSKTKTGLSSGYSYKVNVVAKVYSGSTLVETATKDSSIVKY